jgi:hypothetical protein
MYRCRYFKIQELVSPIVYYKYGDFCWRFFSDNIKKDLDTIRGTHGCSIIINDWVFGGKKYKQCGFRSNQDDLVKSKKTLYCSAHCLGKAFDLHSLHSNADLYSEITQLKQKGLLLAINRIESPKSTGNGWVHIDELGTDLEGRLEVFTDS